MIELACPTPILRHDRIVLGHGSGGRLSAELVARVFLPAFGGDTLGALEDQATLPAFVGGTGPGERLAMTTDAFVVRPLFFPGGDIGHLAVNGTVNDLAVGGAIPRYLAAAFILEEGLPVADLERVVASMRAACDEAGVSLVTGDTKVVERGKGDRIFITTTGIGVVPTGVSLSIHAARPGDVVLVSGTLGDHGMTLMCMREGIALDTPLRSDTAALHTIAQALLRAAPGLRTMRDPTRGGLASTLNELATASRVGVRVHETSLPIRREVRGACELLGLDPMQVANEGKLVAVVPRAEADAALAALRAHPLGRDAAVIGELVAEEPGLVTVESGIGGRRILAMLAGEQLPRIC